MRVALKKAFGIRTVPINTMAIMMIFAGHNYAITEQDIEFQISWGEFGTNQTEREQIARFMHSDERVEYMNNPSPTLTINLDFEIPDDRVLDLTTSRTNFEAALRGIIPKALRALNRILLVSRGKLVSASTFTNEYKMKNLVEGTRLFKNLEFRKFLFYSTTANAQDYAGFIGEGETFSSQSLSSQTLEEIKADLASREGAYEYLLRAIENHVDEDFNMSVLNCAIACELSINKFLRRKLGDGNRISDSQIDKFLDEINNRLLLTVVLAQLTDIDSTLLNKSKDVFVLRNKVAHGIRNNMTHDESLECLQTTEILHHALSVRLTTSLV